MLKKATVLLAGILIAYVALVATHQGEFWPFSIYPMFSQGGQPWTHIIVRKLPVHPSSVSWDKQSRHSLPGHALGLNSFKNDARSLSDFLTRDINWSDNKRQQLRAHFEQRLSRNSFLILKAKGKIGEGTNAVTTSYTPYILIKQDTTIFNPRVYSSLKS